MADLFSPETELVGEVTDVLFQNEENGYAVIRLAVQGSPRPVTVTGTLFGLGAGSRVRVSGVFKEHQKYGRQLHASRHEEVLPRSHAGMVAFLSSQFSGIGEKLAERIVGKFGDATYEVLDGDAMRIAGVEGVGRKKAKTIAAQWDSRKGIREAATFLADYGVGPGQVARVFRHYGDATVGLVKSNPYRLADDVKGIGFKTADRIARNIGVPHDSPERARAAVLYLLGEASGQGHLLLPAEVLLRRAGALDVAEAAAREALDALERDREVVVEAAPPAAPATAEVVAPPDEGGGAGWDRRGPVVYQRRVHFEEDVVATLLAARAARDGDPAKALEKVRWRAAAAGLELAPEQEEAVAAALTHRVAVVTGGPGVGKTTIVRLLLEEVVSRGADVSLAAPTGRAAKRLSEASGGDASTIHRLLRFDPFTNRFTHSHEDPLPCDHLIVDECSMLDVPLAAALLDALDDRARLTLVGDADQLPSVGPGDFFRAVCAAGTLPVTRLTRVFRQREGSRIVEGAHEVNRGAFPTFDRPGRGGEFYFVEKDDPEAVAEMIRTLVCERIPEVYGLDARVDVQTLTPMHKGAAGAENLNAVLGAALNPTPPATLKRGDRVLRTGDRVVQVRNDYDKGTFNGDQGFVVDVDERKRSLVVVIDGREVKYEGDDVGMLLPAWATTVHRAQGGEHKAVVLALTGQHFPLLRRNLVYTAITRARQLCVIVGSRRAIERAIRTESTNDRYSWLEERLRAKGPPP